MTAFVYKWTHIPTLNWYVGSRTKPGCHLDDGYICSSKVVKPLILTNRNEWQRTIIATGSIEEMLDLEYTILYCTNAKKDTRSFNKHNGDGIGRFSNAGKCFGPQSKEHKLKRSLAMKGKNAVPQSEEHKLKRSLLLKGKSWSKARREAQINKI